MTDEEVARATALARGWDTAAEPGELASWFCNGKHTGYITRAIRAKDWDERRICRIPVWDPANHIEQAMDLLEHWKDWSVDRRDILGQPRYTCRIFTARGLVGEGEFEDSKGLAICLAVLKAKGLEKEERR